MDLGIKNADALSYHDRSLTWGWRRQKVLLGFIVGCGIVVEAALRRKGRSWRCICMQLLIVKDLIVLVIIQIQIAYPEGTAGECSGKAEVEVVP